MDMGTKDTKRWKAVLKITKTKVAEEQTPGVLSESSESMDTSSAAHNKCILIPLRGFDWSFS